MSWTLTAEKWWDLAGNDPELRHAFRGFDGILRLTIPPVSVDLVIARGKPVEARQAQGDVDLELTMPAELLDLVSRGTPPPGYQGFVLSLGNGATLRGDAQASVLYLQALSRIYELLRGAHGAPAEIAMPTGGELFPDTDSAIGRYVHVEVDGVPYRIFYEEAGSGAQPLILQHTAGADARQWRHQLADPEFQSRFRMIAYDLPFHGRSLPPTARPWWSQRHVPTKQWLMKVVLAIGEALELKAPIFMGCSVGGQLALDLAAHHGDRFKAFIALNGTLDIAPVPGSDFMSMVTDPRVPTDWYGVYMHNQTSPNAPEALRREVYWVYASNHRSVFPADLVYFGGEHDLKLDGHLLRSDRDAIYALAGEYDPVALDAEHGAPAVARMFPGVIFRELKGSGHFAPSDDPINFREQVLPILEEVAATAR